MFWHLVFEYIREHMIEQQEDTFLPLIKLVFYFTIDCSILNFQFFMCDMKGHAEEFSRIMYVQLPPLI